MLRAINGGVLLSKACPLTRTEVVRKSCDYVYFGYGKTIYFLNDSSVPHLTCPLFQKAKLAHGDCRNRGTVNCHVLCIWEINESKKKEGKQGIL